VGGYVEIAANIFKPLIGCILVLAAIGLLRMPRAGKVQRISLGLALLCGAALGLLSGLSGTGGGIFLSPLLLLMGWADTQQTAGITAAFVLVNSVAGITGLLSLEQHVPSQLGYWAIAAITGGYVGSELGIRRLSSPLLRRILAAVLLIAAGKLVLTR
jgi:uncharacterized membrane protein YfcA